MENGAPPSGKGPSRSGTKARPTGPVDPRTESLPGAGTVEAGAPGNGNGRGRSGSGGAGNGAGSSPGQRLKRRLAASALTQPTSDSGIDAPDAVDDRAAVAELPAGTGPALLPPIRTAPSAADDEATPAARSDRGGPAVDPTPSSWARPGPAAPDVHPVESPTGSTVISPSRVMPFIRPPSAPDGTGELVARKVVAPPVVLDVPLDPTGPQPVQPRGGRPSITFQRRRTRPRVRRVTRVVRHVDTWSVFKVALVFSVFLYAVLLTTGVLLWHVAVATGTIDNVERFFEGFGWETFKFKGGEIYHNAWIAGLFVAIGLTGLAVLVATMFNLITDLVGGIRVSVLEEEVLARRDRTAKVVVEDEPDAGLPYDQARSG